MTILTKNAIVKPHGKASKHYKSLGYEWDNGETIEVPLEDLPKGSHQVIEMECDNCGAIYTTSYKTLVKTGQIERQEHYCLKCRFPVCTEKKYGVKSCMQLPGFVEKANETKRKKYGDDFGKKTLEKASDTMEDRYGVRHAYQIDGVKEKIVATNKERYGENYGKVFHERAVETLKNRYGVSSPIEVPGALEKNIETFQSHYGDYNTGKSQILQEAMLNKYGKTSVSNEEWQKENVKNSKIERFGDNYGELIFEKSRFTMQKRYGVTSATKIPGVLDKIKNTRFEKYGQYQPINFAEKRDKTCRQKYGDDYQMQFLEKQQATMFDRYGVSNPMHVPEIRERIAKSYYKNGSQKCSSQQFMVYEMLKTLFPFSEIELNYPFSTLSLDIAIIDAKIAIEYDGSYWHQDSQKDRRRDEFVKSQGWKVLRIKSGHKLPTNDQLKEAVERLLNGFSFAQIILDDWKEESKDEQFVDSISE